MIEATVHIEFPRRLALWQTKDGQTFPTEELARIHQAHLDLADLVFEISDDNYDARDIVEWLKKHRVKVALYLSQIYGETK